MGITIAIGVALLLIYSFFSSKRDLEAKQASALKTNQMLEAAQQRFPTIDPNRAIVDGPRTMTIALIPPDDPTSLILVRREQITVSVREYRPADILSVEIITDGVSVTRTDRGGQVVGAAVGGALLGGAGAVIGGLSSATTSTNVVSSIELRLLVNDPAQPLISFKCFEMPSNLAEAAKPVADKAYQTTLDLHAKISVMIHRGGVQIS